MKTLRLAPFLPLLLAWACGQTASFTEKTVTASQDPQSVGSAGTQDATPIQGQGGTPSGGADADATVVKAGVDSQTTTEDGADAGNGGGAQHQGADGGTGTPDEPVGFVTPGGESTVIARLKKLPKFGMLVNDLRCGLCHVNVIGDVASTRDVMPPRADSTTSITGRWLAAGQFEAQTWVTAAGGIHDHYTGPEMPIDSDKDGHVDFPAIDFASLPATVTGKVTAGAVTIDKVAASNVVLIGTLSAPIQLAGAVLVQGDVVIKGYYTGNGTIYATGNIYIPFDLQAVRSAFPYPDDPVAAEKRADELVTAADTDSLALATAKSVLIADLESHQQGCCGTQTIYNYPTVPVDRQAAALEVYKVYDWFPGGKVGYDALYEKAVQCSTGQRTQIASFNLVEAFLYARKAVAGITRSASFSIRGGVIADYMHVISGAANCPATISPVHKRLQNASYVEYDYRIQTGKLRMLDALTDSFPGNQGDEK